MNICHEIKWERKHTQKIHRNQKWQKDSDRNPKCKFIYWNRYFLLA